MPKVSVIVPAYNCSFLVERLLMSLKNQVFKDFEVIVVNDGSSDDTELVILNWIRQFGDKRFNLYTKENAGVSAARNFGIHRATGEFIVFADADDYVSERYLDTYSKKIMESKNDIEFFNAYVVSDKAGIKENIVLNRAKYLKSTAVSLIIGITTSDIPGYPFLHISRREFWDSEPFNEDLYIQEDMDALAEVILRNNITKYGLNDETEYFYVDNGDSVTHQLNPDNCNQFLQVACALYQRSLKLQATHNELNIVKSGMLGAYLNMVKFGILFNKKDYYLKGKSKYLNLIKDVQFLSGRLAFKRYIQAGIMILNIKRALIRD
ncbi:glycosyltransferase family 2 protein [Weissella cibaria]|uniref:glycosyltransferase family 2 protein n=1 Tax=Weissella cibaria TaxID=137591 RepID=UPI00223BAE60|nr:glycosyltransferase family 2 protein [Weissella cibaria]